jgi:hypothetical protein
VQDDQRSFALGIQWIKVRLIGTIPAPMVFGALIDETCVLWQESCHQDEIGACLVYDNEYMGRYVLQCSALPTGPLTKGTDTLSYSLRNYPLKN